MEWQRACLVSARPWFKKGKKKTLPYFLKNHIKDILIKEEVDHLWYSNNWITSEKEKPPTPKLVLNKYLAPSLVKNKFRIRAHCSLLLRWGEFVLEDAGSGVCAKVPWHSGFSLGRQQPSRAVPGQKNHRGAVSLREENPTHLGWNSVHFLNLHLPANFYV